VVAVPGGHKTNEDLLAEIFGGSTATSSATPTTPNSQPQKSTASDILGLFDSPAPSSALPQAAAAAAPPPTTASSLFDLTSSVSPSAPSPRPAAAAAAAAPKLPSYTVYDKNDLVISLTPQRSTTHPGVVDILARFQVKGSTTATGLNFQVAVPKVSENAGKAHGLADGAIYLSTAYFYRRNNYRCSPCHARMSTLERQRRSKCALPRLWV
jgi:AP-1 complex subunit gamma-1